jgi:hypothetical protein
LHEEWAAVEGACSNSTTAGDGCVGGDSTSLMADVQVLKKEIVTPYR